MADPEKIDIELFYVYLYNQRGRLVLSHRKFSSDPTGACGAATARICIKAIEAAMLALEACSDVYHAEPLPDSYPTPKNLISDEATKGESAPL